MAALPKVVSPLVRVAEREGIEVVLVSVEAWPDEVVVRLRGLPTDLTARLDASFHEDLERWHAEGAYGPPPPQPADEVFDLDVSVGDDAETRYAFYSSAIGGTERMFRAEWTFRPGPPESANKLRVRIDDLETPIELN
jgi:hypothetical protein